MAFKYEIRCVSKEEKKVLYPKYNRLLRKNNKDILKVITQLILDIIYLYFDNPRRKLKKIFWPVIMANLMENGSIHSVIHQYRESKNLYSWSYTCRMLNLLDEDAGLEISKIFREILFKILKKKGFKNKGYIVAIDITVKPFYGNKNLLLTSGCKKKCGTNYGIHYLTASIVEEGVRFNLICIPVNQMTLIDRKIEEIVNEAKKHIKIKLLFLDRGFANRKYCKLLKKLKYKYLMPLTKNPKLQELEESIKRQSSPGKNEYDIIILDYTFYENKPSEYQETVRMLVVHESGEIHYFITNIYGFKAEEYYDLVSIYRYRFGIETNYRVDNVFDPLTSTQSAPFRYILMQISMVIQDLWTFFSYLFHDKDKKQPRERYKKNGSLRSIIRARIMKLGFIWRPVKTAAQFKEGVKRVLT